MYSLSIKEGTKSQLRVSRKSGLFKAIQEMQLKTDIELFFEFLHHNILEKDEDHQQLVYCLGMQTMENGDFIIPQARPGF